MVYTLTCNPTVEYEAEVAEFTPGLENRSRNERAFVGGKGIHAARILRSLGVQSRILGFLAGFTGDFIERELRGEGCETAFIRLEEGFSRLRVRIRSAEESAVSGSAPGISETAMETLLAQTDAMQSGDLLLVTGDAPPCAPKDFYERLLERLEGRDVYTVLDIPGEALLRLLRYRPFLVKPNRQELEEMAGRRLFTREEMLAEGRRLREMGAQNVLLSMAAEGAALLNGEETLFGVAPHGQALRPAGAGEAMLAGFAAGWLRTGSFREALRLGIAAGSASVFCRGEVSGEEIRRLYEGKILCRTEAGENRKGLRENPT